MNVHHFISERAQDRLREWIDAILAVIFLALVIVVPGSLVMLGIVTLWKKVFG